MPVIQETNLLFIQEIPCIHCRVEDFPLLAPTEGYGIRCKLCGKQQTRDQWIIWANACAIEREKEIPYIS